MGQYLNALERRFRRTWRRSCSFAHTVNRSGMSRERRSTCSSPGSRCSSTSRTREATAISSRWGGIICSVIVSASSTLLTSWRSSPQLLIAVSRNCACEAASRRPCCILNKSREPSRDVRGVRSSWFICRMN